jgi:4'-phosphopantetheinyl transferase
MAHLQDAQPAAALEAFGLTSMFVGGRADALVALRDDLTLPPSTPAEIAAAPRKPVLRENWLARRGFARRALARRLECAAEDVALGAEPGGAPEILAPACDLHLSLSSRADLFAVAFAEKPVGVDIEPVGALFEHPLNVMHACEREKLAAAGDGAHELFLKLWTAKEAYLKALKTGFGREPSEIEIRVAPETKSSGALHARGPDVTIFDRGVQIPLASAFVQILGYADRRLALACIVLA